MSTSIKSINSQPTTPEIDGITSILSSETTEVPTQLEAELIKIDTMAESIENGDYPNVVLSEENTQSKEKHRETILKEIDEIETTTQEYLKLQIIFGSRSEINYEPIPESPYLKVFRHFKSNPTFDYPVSYYLAMDMYIQQTISDLKKHDEYPLSQEEENERANRLKTYDVNQIAQRIEISAANIDEGEKPIITDIEICEMLKQVPACFLSTISSISFDHPISEESEEKENIMSKKFRTVGINRSRYDKAINYQSKLLIDRMTKTSNDTALPEFIIQKEAVKDTLIHECGHSIHHYLDNTDMLTWQAIATSQYNRETSQLQKELAKNSPFSNPENRYIREDFAHSYSEFINNPKYLLYKFPDRFRFMFDLSRKYMSPTQFHPLKQTLAKKMEPRQLEQFYKIAEQ